MLEKRKSQRIPLQMNLQICDLYKQDASGIHHLDAPIELTDISEQGIGFVSECILPLQYHFHACLSLDSKKDFLIALKINRCSVMDRDHYYYGCEFIALDDTVRDIIRQYISSKSTS